MRKNELSEQDIRTKFINKAIRNAGWDMDNQLREEYYFTDGKIKVRGKMVSRGKAKKADYVLYHDKGNIFLAIVEAKSNDKPLGTGLPQALDYVQILDVPFAFSSNGDGFIQRDRTTSDASEGKKEERMGSVTFHPRRSCGPNIKPGKGSKRMRGR